MHAHFPSTTRTTASRRMESPSSTSQEASTTRAFLGNIGRTGCSRCTWLDSMLFRCTWNRETVQTLCTHLCYTSCQTYVFAVMQVCAMELPRDCAGGVQLRRRQRSWVLLEPGQSDGAVSHPASRAVHLCRMGNGDCYFLMLLNFNVFVIGQWVLYIAACDYENLTFQGGCF